MMMLRMKDKCWPRPYRDDRLLAIHCTAFIAALPLDSKANDPMSSVREPQMERFPLVECWQETNEEGILIMAEAKKSTAKTSTKAAAKKPAAKKAAAKKAAPQKDTSEMRTTKAQKAAPLKAGATKAAATKKEATVDFKDRALTKAKSAASQGKERTGTAIENLSKMIEDSAKTIDDNVGEKYGDYARSAADAVSSFAEKLNAKEIDEMVEDARDYVRKSPAVAIGAAAVVGFLISRLIKSGMDDRDA
jgi:ElaB/YqjD/DUF883 family membrane-anchored ribosome-binding protein